MRELLKDAQRSGISTEQAMEAFNILISKELPIEQLETELMAISDEDIARETETAKGERLVEVMRLYVSMNFKMRIFRAVIEAQKERSK